MYYDLRLPKWGLWLILITLLTGLTSRLLPLFDFGGRLLQEFPTEDGYLMLTIARNIALGLGMSTSDGTIPTNGVQPFVTLLWALGYVITGSDKVGGVIFAHIVQLIVSILTCALLYRLAKKVFREQTYGEEAALILSALFFASPHILPHTMNFLETGFYLFAIVSVLNMFYETDDEAKQVWSIPKSLKFGLLLGWLFWVRIDSVFIIFAVCIGYLLRGLPYGLPNCILRLKRTILFGATSVVVASPWLINNYIRFGSVIPISGQAQSAKQFAQNIQSVPATLFEYLFVVLPIPHNLETSTIVVIISTLIVLAAAAIFIVAFSRATYGVRCLMLVGAISVVEFVSYYGLYFGAEHFIGRYFSALAPFLALFTTGVILYIFNTRQLKAATLFLPTASLLLVVILIILNVRIYSQGVPHQHWQVVKWVKENVPENIWVGATQTGTLGYFHDRTINLDGKVNPEALAARRGEAYCPENVAPDTPKPTDCLMYYIVDSKVGYLVDWVGITGWSKLPPVNQYFSVVIEDEKNNLGALKRITTQTINPDGA